MIQTKPWYFSWTIWFNVLILLLVFLNSVSAFIPFPTSFVMEMTALLNLLLRLKTTTGIAPDQTVMTTTSGFIQPVATTTTPTTSTINTSADVTGL